MTTLPPNVFNASLEHPTVGTLVRFLGMNAPSFRSDKFIEHMRSAAGFPIISIRHVLDAMREADVRFTAVHLEFAELATLAAPLVAFLKRPDGSEATDPFMILEVRRSRAVLRRDRFGCNTMPIAELRERWTGIAILVKDPRDSGELSDYRRHVRLIEQFLDPKACRNLIDYCEVACFERSRVVHRTKRSTTNVLSLKTRSSSSVTLKDRQHPVLREIYTRCADAEGVPESHVEQIQCVRYKRGQKFRSHFDGGVDLPRLTTYLLYLNDDFEGGETFFPLLDLAIDPQAGACLRFPSCDREGRVLWPSEHGGLPVHSGVKYALNIWVRCPLLERQTMSQHSESG